MKNTRLVYSTETGRLCPACRKPISDCICQQQRPAVTPPDGAIRIRREVKGRKGKTVTVADGFGLPPAEVKQLAADLKRLCGTGGTVKDGTIVLQGDHRRTVLAELKKRKISAKLAGG